MSSRVHRRICVPTFDLVTTRRWIRAIRKMWRIFWDYRNFTAKYLQSYNLVYLLKNYLVFSSIGIAFNFSTRFFDSVPSSFLCLYCVNALTYVEPKTWSSQVENLTVFFSCRESSLTNELRRCLAVDACVGASVYINYTVHIYIYIYIYIYTHAYICIYKYKYSWDWHVASIELRENEAGQKCQWPQKTTWFIHRTYSMILLTYDLKISVIIFIFTLLFF